MIRDRKGRIKMAKNNKEVEEDLIRVTNEVIAGEKIINIETSGKGITIIPEDHPQYLDVLRYERQILVNKPINRVVTVKETRPKVSYALQNKQDTRRREYDTRQIPASSISSRIIQSQEYNTLKLDKGSSEVGTETMFTTLKEEIVTYDENGIPKIITRLEGSEGISAYVYAKNSIFSVKYYKLSNRELEKLVNSMELTRFNNKTHADILVRAEELCLNSNADGISFAILTEIKMGEVIWESEADEIIEYEYRNKNINLMFLKNIKNYHDSVRICEPMSNEVDDNMGNVSIRLIDNDLLFKEGVSVKFFKQVFRIMPERDEFLENGVYVHGEGEILHVIPLEEFDDIGIYRKEEYIDVFEHEELKKKGVIIDTLEAKLKKKENDILSQKTALLELKNKQVENDVRKSSFLRLLDMIKSLASGYATILSAFSKIAI